MRYGLCVSRKFMKYKIKNIKLAKQGKKRIKTYKDLDNVPGNKFARPPLHYNCRSRIRPIIN